MNRMLKIISSGLMMTMLLASAAAQQRSDSSNAKSKTAATTGSQNRIVKFVAPGVIGDSYITEDKFGNVGIGTTTPTSPLTVQGMIEITLGGLRFPDGTMQTSAPVTKVLHNLTLTGDGTTASPLAITVPLNLKGKDTVLEVESTEATIGSVSAIRVVGGPSSTTFGGDGVISYGGNSTSNRMGGAGLVGIGGIGPVGGRGLEVIGGPAFGAGNEAGDGIVALPGQADNGATKGKAGRFFGDVEIIGDVEIAGTLSKAGGSFKIDHPLDPENKYLSHSFVESPDMKNIYDGVASLDQNGEATVEMPEWFSALNRDFRYLLTALGAPMPGLYVAGEIENNRFRIAGGAPGMKVSWQVTGVRQDAWANRNRIRVEEVKSERERGLYLHPEAFDKAEERGVAHQSEQMRERKQRRLDTETTHKQPN